MAAVIVAVLYSLSYFKPAGAAVWPRAVSLPILVTMLQVSHGAGRCYLHVLCRMPRSVVTGRADTEHTAALPDAAAG